MDNFTELKLMNAAIRSFTNNEAYYRWKTYLPEVIDSNTLRELAEDQETFDFLKLKFNNLFIKFYQFGFNSGSKEVKDFVNNKQNELFINNANITDAKQLNFEDKDYLEELLEDYSIPLTPEELCEKLVPYYHGNLDDFDVAMMEVLSKYIDDPTSLDEYNEYASLKNKEQIFKISEFNDIVSLSDPIEIAKMVVKGKFNPATAKWFSFADKGDSIIGFENKEDFLENQDFQDWRIESRFEDLYKDDDFKKQIVAGIKQLAQD